jgi:O-antigen/teichoic acid export membrane protein
MNVAGPTAARAAGPRDHGQHRRRPEVGVEGSSPAGPPAAPADGAAGGDGAHEAQPHGTRALRGTVWTVGGFGSAQILRFAFNLILTRLLLPEVFGLMALVNALVLGLQLFSDVGIGPSIIQHKLGEESRFLNTAWTLQVMRGWLLWLCSALLAWPLAAFYETPALAWLVPAVGANAAIAGFNATALHTLARRVVRGPLVLLNLGAYLVGMAVTIAWVLWVRADVWGFVIGSLVTSLVTMAGSHLLVPGFRNRLCWDRTCLGELILFGKWIFLSTLCTFLADQTDRLVVGKVASLEILGLYQVAHQLAWMPARLLYMLTGQVVFPLYSRQHQSPQGIAPAVRRLHPLVAGFGAAMATGLLVTGPTLIRCLYGTRYEAAGWMVRVLAVAALLKMLEAAASAALMATGQARAPAVSNGAKTLALVVLMPVGYWCYGLPGLLAALVATDLVRYAATASALRRRGLRVLRYDVLLLLCVAGVAVAALYASGHPWLPANNWLRLGIGAFVILLLWVGILLAAWARWARQHADATVQAGAC